MHLAFYQPDIPQNLGAAMRLTACFQVPLHVIEPCAFPLTEKGLRRAAMDYADFVDLRRHRSWDDFSIAPDLAGNRRVLFTTKGAARLDEFTFRSDDILLFGRESAGVPEAVHAAADARVFIPMRAETRSLNLVTSAAMGLGEALRQTQSFPKSSSE